MLMRVIIYADCYADLRGYQGAMLDLPATPYEVRDALQRARVPEGGGYTMKGAGDWPDFLWTALFHTGALSGENALKELNLLAHAVSHMDEIQIGTFEGAVELHWEEKRGAATVKELINLAFCLDDYEFHPGVTNDRILGEACMEGGMLDLVDGLPDQVAELIEPTKVGKLLRQSDHGLFTSYGYVYRSTAACREPYDGVHLPDSGDFHSGRLSLRIVKADAQGKSSGVWLELPADEKALQWALLSIDEQSFDACRIAETRSIIPAFRYQMAGDEDVGKLNTLAERLRKLQQEAPDDMMLMKYKAVLELEQCFDLDMALDIAANLDCYNLSPDVLSPDAYGEYVLQSAGIDTGDPAFSRFDFRGYGERQMGQSGYVFTPYGAVSRNGQVSVHGYTEQGQGMAMEQ